MRQGRDDDDLKVAIIGTRDTPDNIYIKVFAHVPQGTSEIVSGGSEGVDRAAEQVAEALALPIRRFLPDYSAYGKRAPIVRNGLIVDYCDSLLAFWDGSSRGTGYTIAQCVKRGKPVRIIPI